MPRRLAKRAIAVDLRRRPLGVREEVMDIKSLEQLGIRRVAVIGAGTIGASWAAWLLARGLDVSASDPAPDAEAFLRRFCAAAWPTLAALGAVVTDATPDALSFRREPEDAVAGADFVQENAPE